MENMKEFVNIETGCYKKKRTYRNGLIKQKF